MPQSAQSETPLIVGKANMRVDKLLSEFCHHSRSQGCDLVATLQSRRCEPRRPIVNLFVSAQPATESIYISGGRCHITGTRIPRQRLAMGVDICSQIGKKLFVRASKCDVFQLGLRTV